MLLINYKNASKRIWQVFFFTCILLLAAKEHVNYLEFSFLCNMEKATMIFDYIKKPL